MVTSDKNFNFSLRADLIKTISSFTDNLSYETLEKLSSAPNNPSSVNDFITHLSDVPIPYSGFIRNLIIDQFSHTTAFLYCIEEKMFPIFYIHGIKSPYKVPHIDEHQTLTYAEYSPSMFDLTGNFSPRFLINFSSEDKIAGFLYNFESSLKSYFQGVKDNASKYKEVYEQFKEHIAISLAHPSVMTYQVLIQSLHNIDPNYIFSHSDDTKMYFKYNDSGLMLPFPITNKGLYRSFQKNFRETNQKLIPSNAEFVTGIRLYYNEIQKKLDNNEPIKEITAISLNSNSDSSENNINSTPELLPQTIFEHENNTSELDITNLVEATLVYSQNNDTIEPNKEDNSFFEPEIKEKITEYQEPKDNNTISHNSILEDDYVFSTSFED